MHFMTIFFVDHFFNPIGPLADFAGFMPTSEYRSKSIRGADLLKNLKSYVTRRMPTVQSGAPGCAILARYRAVVEQCRVWSILKR
jgi:hypothetical protein